MCLLAARESAPNRRQFGVRGSRMLEKMRLAATEFEFRVGTCKKAAQDRRLCSRQKRPLAIADAPERAFCFVGFPIAERS